MGTGIHRCKILAALLAQLFLLLLLCGAAALVRNRRAGMLPIWHTCCLCLQQSFVWAAQLLRH
jgi:hypothetical protein